MSRRIRLSIALAVLLFAAGAGAWDAPIFNTASREEIPYCLRYGCSYPVVHSADFAGAAHFRPAHD